MPADNIETFPTDGKWRNRVWILSESFDSREEAIESARELARARQIDHVVRHPDGSEDRASGWSPRAAHYAEPSAGYPDLRERV